MTVTAFKNCRFSINWGSLVQPRNYQMLKDQYRAYRNKFMQQILLKKQIVPQLINKFSAFYGARSFITEFTTARHWNLPLAKLKESTSSHPNSLRSHPTSLRSHLCLGLPSGLFPSYFLAKSLHKFPQSPCMPYAQPNPSSIIFALKTPKNIRAVLWDLKEYLL